MYDEIITLLSEETTITIPGQGKKKTWAEREVFVKLLNIGSQEFYQAQANGLKPEVKLELADYLDYQDEKEFIFGGCKYQVLRTYRKGRRLELTGYGGVNIGTT